MKNNVQKQIAEKGVRDRQRNKQLRRLNWDVLTRKISYRNGKQIYCQIIEVKSYQIEPKT